MAGPTIKTDLAFQSQYLSWVAERKFDGLFADAGTGKTRMYLRRGELLHQSGQIDAMLVLAINSVKTNFVAWPHMLEELDEEADSVTTHIGDDNVVKGVWVSGATGRDKKAWEDFEKKIEKTDKMIVLVVNFESLLSEQFYAFLQAFLKKYRTYFVVDEGTKIGEPGSQRTKRAIKLAPLAAFRCDGTATPILKRPTKIFSQAKFLDKSALGFNSFYSFRNRYCVMGGFEGRQIVEYKHLDELGEKIASWSFSVKLEDVHEMPPRDWKKHYVSMTAEQGRAYRTMREEFIARVADQEITASIVLAQMTRLQQILGGFISKDGIEIEIIPSDRNPKVLEAWDIIRDAPAQSVVWFRFVPELKAMARFLASKGVSFYEFHGEYDDKEKLVIRKSFKRGDRQVLLGTASSGGIGIDEFKVARDAIFFSNDFDTERRFQTERRTWRIGVVDATRYHDILVPNSVDTKIIKVLRGDAKLSARIRGEQWKEWI
jgi:SNF2 family DNA or RNA helicase